MDTRLEAAFYDVGDDGAVDVGDDMPEAGAARHAYEDLHRVVVVDRLVVLGVGADLGGEAAVVAPDPDEEVAA